MSTVSADDLAAASPVSSDLSEAEDEPEASSSSPRADEELVRHSSGGYKWRVKESELYLKLLAGYKKRQVDWQAIADELHRQCPMGEGVPPRTAIQCQSRKSSLKSRRPTAESKAKLVRWTDQDKAELHQRVQSTLRASGKAKLSPSEWSQLGAELSTVRTGTACQQMYHTLGQANYQPKAGPGLVQSTAASPSPVSPILSSPALKSPSSTSHSTQPFSPADDLTLLDLYRELGPLYKAISRKMEPQRHKKEVRERLEYLFGGYDVDVLMSDE